MKTISIAESCLKQLRALRLWHWNELQKALMPDNNGRINKTQHIKFIQTLNDFFPIGDTAEKDAAK